MAERIDKIVELGIDIDDAQNEELFEDLGVSVISFVESPAIEESFLYFSQEGTFLHDCGNGEMVEKVEEFGKITISASDIQVDLSTGELEDIQDVLKGLQAADALQRFNIDSNTEASEYFRYSGPASNSHFCSTLLEMSKNGKLFTQEEVTELQKCQGSTCGHQFERVFAFQNEDNNKVILSVDKNEPKVASRSSKFSFKVLDGERREIYGPVMIARKMILRRDEEGNLFYVYFSAETIRKMAAKFMANNYQNNTDVEHDGNVTQENTLIESWVSDDEIHDKSYTLGFRLPKDTWYVGIKVNNEELWDDIKEGRRNGLSLAGQFIDRL